MCQPAMGDAPGCRGLGDEHGDGDCCEMEKSCIISVQRAGAVAACSNEMNQLSECDPSVSPIKI